MSGHFKKFEERHLNPNEKALKYAEGYIGDAMGSGAKTQKNGVLIVTTDRVVFYRKGFLGETIESIPLKKITSIERRSMLGFRTIRLHTSHDQLEFKMLGDDSNIVAGIEEGRDKAQSTTPTVTSQSPTQDPMDALKKLAELRDAGIVTEDEFQAKKAALLSKL